MIYVFLTILLTVYGQLVIKWQVIKAGALPTSTSQKIYFLAGLIFNPWVLSAVGAAFLASLSWMAAMTKLELSYAYPFMSLSFVLVLGLSALLFLESLTLPKLLGMGFIIVGIIIGSRG